MEYISTRGGMAAMGFSDILISGLATDGGLAMPQRYPAVSAAELAEWRHLDYADLATEVISRFATDLPPDDLRTVIHDTYTADIFRDAAITPVSTLSDGVHLLHLSNGPTLAFKDIAMQLLGNLFEYVLAREAKDLNILGATSGDTGSAAEYAMRGRERIRVFMLSPHGKMSPFQCAQMYTLQDDNIHNIAVHGVFDDCQDMVKGVSADAEFKSRYRIGTVNSINWARITAQVVYYFRAYFAVTEDNDQSVAFSVPSGNFGNIMAGHIARQMGLPIARLILATNENDVLNEFFRSGVYRIRPSAEVEKTSSPSMDISKASNFERFIYDVVDGDTARVKALWDELSQTGQFDLSADPCFQSIDRFGFAAGRSTHQDRLEIIRRVYRDNNYIVDTHTADGIKVGLEHRLPGVPLVCLETALPAKFEETIHEALGHGPERPAGYEGIEALPQHFTTMAAEVDAIKSYIAKACYQ